MRRRVVCVIDGPEEVKSLDEAAQLLQDAGNSCRPVIGLESACQPQCLHDAEAARENLVIGPA